MAAEGLGNTHIPPRPCLKPNEMPCHQSNFLGGWLLPRGLLVFQVEFEAQPGLFFFFFAPFFALDQVSQVSIKSPDLLRVAEQQ